MFIYYYWIVTPSVFIIILVYFVRDGPRSLSSLPRAASGKGMAGRRRGKNAGARRNSVMESFELGDLSSTDGMLFRANVANNGRYRYVILSLEDDEKSSRPPARVHKIYNGCTIHYCRTAGGGRRGADAVAGRRKTKH